MLTRNLQLAWQFYHQEKHYAHHQVLRWTQAILMVFVITLSQTSQSIQNFLSNNLENLLGADVVLIHKHALTKKQHAELNNISQKLISTQNINTTLTHADKWQRAKLKAVDNNYPLQGKLKIASALGDTPQPSSAGPKPGEIWLDSRLLTSLSLQVGTNIKLANEYFTVARILLHEPDRLMEGHSVDMRAMINKQDLRRLGFPNDLIEHRYLIGADSTQIKKIVTWQKQSLPAAQTYHKQGAHPLALFWQRSENFIGLASIILFFMAAVAVEQLSHVQIHKEQYFSSICISLGAKRSTIWQVSAFKWILRLVLLLPIVVLVSATCHWLIIHWLSDTFVGLSWQWHTGLALQSGAAIAMIFIIFQAPVWISLKQSSVRLLAYNNKYSLSYWFGTASALSVLMAVAFVYSDNTLLTSMVMTCTITSVLLILIISWLILTLGEKFTQNFSGLLPFTLFMMKQRLVSKSTQILGLGLCAFLLLFTLMLLKDLGETMQNYSRQHDGNLLVSQANQQQMHDILSWTKSHNIPIRQNKPYVYAKLTHVNDQHLDDFSDKPSDSLSTFKSSIRLHWTDSVPANNKLLEGRWWTATYKNWQQISIEQEVMTDLGLKLGDQLTFYIGEQSIRFSIVATHAYKPGAGSITFWVQIPTTALANMRAPQYNIASLELSTEQFSLLTALWQKHPSLRMISLKEMTARFDNILAMITKAISGFSLLIIALALIVMLASIQSLGTKEKQKNSIIMSFGFDKKACFKLNIIEWIITATIAAFGAIVGTYIAGLLIYQSQFSLNYQPNFLWLLATLAIILVTVTSLGIHASKHSLSSSIRELMTES